MASIDELYARDVKHIKDFSRTATGNLELIDGRDNLKQHIYRRIMTEPGSIAHRPNYGVGLKSFQNAPLTLDVKRTLAQRIKDQLEQDVRISRVDGVRVENEDSSPELIKLIVRITPVGFTDAVELSFRPFGDQVR